MRKKKLKSVTNNTTSEDDLLQPEIDRLTKKVEELELQLNQKLSLKNGADSNSAVKSTKEKQASKDGVRIFYNIQENGVNIIIVDQDGNVY